MTSEIETKAESDSITQMSKSPSKETKFDTVMIILVAWFVLGLVLDGWAHHQLGDDLDTFLTPWHGVLYSGFLVVSIFTGITWLIGMFNGLSILTSLPVGYNLTLGGSIAFGIGGVLDFFWHEAFGIEVNVAALYSPTHVILIVGGALIWSGPLRSKWFTPQNSGQSLISLLPMLFSVSFLMTAFTVFSETTHPFHQLVKNLSAERPAPSEEFVVFYEALGSTGAIVLSAILMGFLLMVIKRFELPFGALTVIITTSGITMAIPGVEFRMIPVAFITGLAADFVYSKLAVSFDNPRSVRIFSLSVPFIFFSLYFLTLFLTTGVWWNISLWLGTIVLASLTGLSMSYLALTPKIPVDSEKPV